MSIPPSGPAFPAVPPPPQPGSGPNPFTQQPAPSVPPPPGFPPVGAQPPGASPPGGRPPAAPPGDKRGRSGVILLTVGLAVIALLCGGTLGGGTGWLTGKPDGSETVPPFAEDFPRGEQQYMQGVTVSLVADDWLIKSNKWECEDRSEEDTDLGRVDYKTCRPPGDASSDMSVTIHSQGEDKVREVDATCWEGVGSKACKSLFSTLADTVFIPQDNLRKQASDWAAKNSGTERFTTIGHIRLEANLEPNGMRAIPAI